ncbi:MAG: DUF547 domain-containing protein [Burkholderiaceae bacterium]
MKRSFQRLGLALASLCLSACTTLVSLPASPQNSPDPNAAQARQAWGRVLQAHVNERGEVDFAALAEVHSTGYQDLVLAVRHIAQTPLASLPEPETRLAHMVNAYNALSMFNVVASGIPDTHAGLNKVNFFVLRKFTIGGQPMSLYVFENDIIRPLAREMGLPEVHFALNCSAVSCPVLPRVPFSASALRGELLHEARTFFASPRNWRIDSATQTVWLSEILKFYPEDFVPAHGRNLIEYGNRHAAQAAPLDFEVRFTPYDWTVANSRRKP